MMSNINYGALLGSLVSNFGGPPPPPPFSPGGPPVVMPGGGTYTPPSAPPSYSPSTVAPPSYSSPSYNPTTWAQQHGGTYTPPATVAPSQPDNPYSVLYTKMANLEKERNDLYAKRNGEDVTTAEISKYNQLIGKINAEITATQAKITALTSKEVQALAGAPSTITGPQSLEPGAARDNMIKIMGQDIAQYFAEQRRLAGIQDYTKIVGKTDTALQAQRQSAAKIIQSVKSDIGMYRQIAQNNLQKALQVKSQLQSKGLSTSTEDKMIAAAQNELNVLKAAEGLLNKPPQNPTDKTGIESLLKIQAVTVLPPKAVAPSSPPTTTTSSSTTPTSELPASLTPGTGGGGGTVPSTTKITPHKAIMGALAVGGIIYLLRNWK